MCSSFNSKNYFFLHNFMTSLHHSPPPSPLQCGNNKTDCPKAPNRTRSSYTKYKKSFFERLKESFDNIIKVFRKHGVKIFITLWIVIVLILLGVIKVVHIVVAGNLGMGLITNPVRIIGGRIMDMMSFVWKEICPAACDSCWTSTLNCSDTCLRNICFVLTLGLVERKREEINVRVEKIERGWRPPPYCNGMCKGAKFRRKIHRKQMRMNKRAGIVGKETPWFKKPYHCSCKVKDTMPIVQICQGLWFFFYCPFLPVYWSLEFIFHFIKHYMKRKRRLKKFRQERAAREAKKDKEYVQLDKYSRGQDTSEVAKLGKDIKKLKKKEKKVCK